MRHSANILGRLASVGFDVQLGLEEPGANRVRQIYGEMTVKRASNANRSADHNPDHEPARDETEHTPPRLTDEESRVWQQMSPATRREIEYIDRQIRSFAAAQRMWDSLTHEQRAECGDNLEAAWRSWGTLGIWMRLHGLTNRFTALISVAKSLWSSDRLMQHASLAAGTENPPAERPHWNRQTGVLTFEGERIREKAIRKFKVRSHIQRIVEAFQNAGWPTSISNPLEDPDDQAKLHQAVYELNSTLSRIRFSADHVNRVVTWAVVEPTPESSQSHLE